MLQHSNPAKPYCSLIYPIQLLVMIFPACKRGLNISSCCLRSFFNFCTHDVRQNASHKLISTKASSAIFKETNSLAIKSLLLKYGFTDANISELYTRSPHVFHLDAKNNILPKLKFFNSIGLSNADLPKLVRRNSYLLSSSLQNQLIPSCNFLLNRVPLTNDQLARALKSYPGVLLVKLDLVLAPNIELLREVGFSPPDIASIVIQRSQALCRNHKAFKGDVDKVFSMGLEPSRKKFHDALKVLTGMSKEILEQKIMLYKSYGISDDEFLLAFRKQPSIVGKSKDNILRSMEFFMYGLKWKPSDIARYPEVLSLNLDKVVRRSRVLEKLVEKGLTPKDRLGKSTFVKLSEKKFLDKFVNKFADDVPEILDIYNDDGGESRKREN